MKYLAYGSNMNIEDMKKRCPDAELVTTGQIDEWRLLFKGEHGYATIDPDYHYSVPVVVWNIGERDVKALDLYEKDSVIYRKGTLTAVTKKGKITGMVYIMMTPDKPDKKPSDEYIDTLKQAYKEHDLPMERLEEALEAIK